MSHRHHAEFLTPARLERLAKHAQDVGDERVLAACRAAPIDAAALRDVAVACERALHEPMSDGDREGLSPGIRLLVEALDAAGFRTTDSGDGTNWAAGMECALPYRHVAVSLAPWQDRHEEAARVRRYLAWLGLEGEFEVTPVDETPGLPDVVFVCDARWIEIEREVGYQPPDAMGCEG